MTTAHTHLTDHELIAKTMQHYIDGARSGSSEDMKPAFREDATVFGHFGEEMLAGPIELLYDWHDGNGPATDLEAEITSVNIAGTVATVRIELVNWTQFRFTDLFTLLKADGGWRIVNKAFHLHAN